MTQQPKRREAPCDPLKRAIGLTVRAIAGDADVEVGYGPQKPAIEGKLVRLPEPSRVPTAGEIAVIRGWADSLALTAACHDETVHRKLAPGSGAAREVFEAIERARVEAVGANRMSGMADNLAAKCESEYAHGRFQHIKSRDDAPLSDALSLMVRERLTGRAPPEMAKALVDLWRPEIEDRAGDVLSRMAGLIENQEGFGRLARDLLKELDLSEDFNEGESAESEDENSETPDSGESDGETEDNEGDKGQDQDREDRQSEGDAGEAKESAETTDRDDFESEDDSTESIETSEPWRPNLSVLDDSGGIRIFGLHPSL